MSLFENDARNDIIVYGSKRLRYFPCHVARPLAVQPYTQARTTVTSPAAGLLMKESSRDKVEMYQSMITQGAMDTFQGRLFQIHVANLSAKRVIFIKNMTVRYASIAPDYNLRPQKEGPNPKRQKRLLPKQSVNYDKTVQGNATEMQKVEETRSSTRNLERDSTEAIAIENAINAR